MNKIMEQVGEVSRSYVQVQYDFENDNNATAHVAEVDKLRAMIEDVIEAPNGWKLVPIDPDELSIQAGCLEQSDSYYKSYKKLADLCSFVVVNQLRNLVIRGYKAMISAAPEYKE
jgi:hypothetical protein